jgi:peptide/nickel transport system substrate-binding protein
VLVGLEAELIAHTVQLSGVFTSDLFKTFVDRDRAQNLVYTPPSGVVVLAPNLSDPVFQSTALRQAINVALDRKNLDMIGESGAEPPASQSGLAGGLTDPFILSNYAVPTHLNVSKARSILQHAGYKLSGGKLFAPG